MAGNKDNMKQAMKELLGMVGIGPEENGEGPAPELKQQEADLRLQQQAAELKIKEQEREAAADMGILESRPDVQATEHGAPQHTTEPQRRQIFQDEFGGGQAGTFLSRPTAPGSTIIATGTTIIGDVRCQSDVECQGNLKGNLQTVGNVRITGKILGDVRGASVELVGCAVQGNITAETEVHLDQGAVVVGDIAASILTSDGRMKGDLQIEKSASFQKNAVLVGNVAAGLISMNEGAKIQGTIRVELSSDNIPDFGVELEI